MLSSIFHMNIRSSHFAIVATSRNGMPVSNSTQMVHAFFYWLIRFFFMIMGCKKVIFLYLKHRRGQTRTTMTVNLLKRYHPSGVFLYYQHVVPDMSFSCRPIQCSSHLFLIWYTLYMKQILRKELHLLKFLYMKIPNLGMRSECLIKNLSRL